MKNRLTILLAVQLLLNMFPASAQQPIKITNNERFFIGKHIGYFIDTSNVASIQEAITQPYLQSKDDILSLNLIHHPVWIRFSMNNIQQSDLYMEVATPLLEQLEVYKLVDGSPRKLFEGGFDSVFVKRPFQTNTWVFNIGDTTNTVITYYIKAKTGFNFQVPIVIYTKASFLQSLRLNDLFWGIYIGTMFFAVVYNLFIFFSVRERRYFYYIIYVIGTTIFYLSLQGYSFKFLWPNHPSFNKHIGAIICVTNIVITLFTMNFLHITKRQKKQYYFGICIIIGFALIGILNFITYYAVTTAPAQMMSLVIASYCIYSGFAGLKRGIHSAKYFAIAWTLFSVLCIIFILAINNTIANNLFTTNGIFIGHVTEVLLLSFALADRINALKKENARFQLEIFKTQLEIQEQTFRTISEELHDNIGQVLVVAKLNLNSIHLELQNGEERKVRVAVELLTKAIQDLRDLSKTLNTDVISALGLKGAIEAELNLLQKTGAIDARCEVVGTAKEFDPNKGLIVFRMVQESINNIIKHSNASEVNIKMIYSDAELNLLITDNGQGFNYKKNNNHGSGMRNIENRCRLLNAKFDILTSPGQGTSLMITLPLLTLKKISDDIIS